MHVEFWLEMYRGDNKVHSVPYEMDVRGQVLLQKCTHFNALKQDERALATQGDRSCLMNSSKAAKFLVVDVNFSHWRPRLPSSTDPKSATMRRVVT